MNAQFEGLRWILDKRTAQSVWDFKRTYRNADYAMPQACASFFEQANIEATVERGWSWSQGGILFFGDHTTPLDGFAISLACPAPLELKRVIFAMSGCMMGKEFCRRNLLVYPKGSYRNLIWKTDGLWNRMIYLVTHRWGPFARKHAAVKAMCESLNRGECVSLLPSGVVGERQWRSGIGSVLLESMQPINPDRRPLFAAPVYLEWEKGRRHVSVSSPGLIRFDSLLRQAGKLQTRDEMTRWLQRCYDDRAWVYDVCNKIPDNIPSESAVGAMSLRWMPVWHHPERIDTAF